MTNRQLHDVVAVVETQSHRPETPSVDPAADLALLGRARRSVDVDQALDFGPAWYAPLLALMVAGLSLAGPGEGAVQVGGWVVGTVVVVPSPGRDDAAEHPVRADATTTRPIIGPRDNSWIDRRTAVESIG